MVESMRKLICCVVVLLSLFVMSGCDEGPMEKAGKAVDEAVEDTGEALEDAGRKISIWDLEKRMGLRKAAL